MQRARHFAAAAKGGGARASEAKANSNIGRGEVTKRRRWLVIVFAMSGKLEKISEPCFLPLRAAILTSAQGRWLL